MPKLLDVNVQGLIKYTRRLDKMRKYDLPDVARRTINTAAFDVKQKYLPAVATRSFVTRNRQFFKRFSKVDPAKGSKINSMRATVGMNSKLYSKPGDAVDNQEMQQTGMGLKAQRTYIPYDQSRVSKSHNKNVRKIYRLDSILDVPMIDTSKVRGNNIKNAKQRYIVGAIKTVRSHGSGGLMKHRWVSSGKTVIYQVKKGGGKGLKTTEGTLKLTPLYSFKEGRTTKPAKKTPYTKTAGRMAGSRINSNFVKYAKQKISK